jgi:hypothetical protein
LLFCSLPLVNYTITDDWPETAASYLAIIACVFAPHALLAVSGTPLGVIRRLLAGAALLGLVWEAVALSHPGYWPLVAITLVASAALAAIRTDYSLPIRLAVIAALGLVSLIVVALLAPDVVHEISIAGSNLKRSIRGPTGGLWASNVPGLLHGGERSPFTFLWMTVSSLIIGFGSRDAARRHVVVGSALMSFGLGFGAATLSTGASRYAPSALWALRDPAIGFAILSAASAAGALDNNRVTRAIGIRAAVVALLLGAVLGPVTVADALFRQVTLADLFDTYVSPQGTTRPEARMSRRGMPADRVPIGSRIALWPRVGQGMRDRKRSQANFADAGYVLVTATTKQRTMKGLVEPNDVLFEQSTYLASEVLCNSMAVTFLQLNYLLAPTPVECDAWRPAEPPMVVDGWLMVHASTALDTRIRALPSAMIAETLRRSPALSAGSSLLSLLTPLPDTSVTLGSRDIVIRQKHPSSSTNLTIILPVAYDSAWITSSGHIDNVGGLLALTKATDARIVLSFAPDVVAILRSSAMILAQFFACLGLIGLSSVAPVTTPSAARVDASVRLYVDDIVLKLRRVVSWLRRYGCWPHPLYIGYSAVMFLTLKWRPEDSDETSLAVALLLPLTAVVVSRVVSSERTHEWLGRLALTMVIIRVLVDGSRSYQALHDPLFWSIVAAAAFGLSIAASRRVRIASTAAALAGATAALAMILPVFPNFDSNFPAINTETVRASLGALSYQLGVLGTILLLALWVRAIGLHAIPFNRIRRPAVIARGALLVGLVLCLAGAVPSPKISAPWMMTLGALFGFAAKFGSAADTTSRG